MINYTPSSHSEWKIYKCWFGVCQMHWRIIRAWGKNMIRCAKNYLGWTPRTLPDEHQALVFIKLTNAIPTVKHGYSIIMLKERFSPLGTRRLLRIKKNMNKPKHSNCSSFKRSYSCGFDRIYWIYRIYLSGLETHRISIEKPWDGIHSLWWIMKGFSK